MNGLYVWVRALLWVVLAVTGGLLLERQEDTLDAVRTQSAEVDQQFCELVGAINTNARFRWHTERRRLRSTRAFLRDPDNRRETPELYRRIKATVKYTEEDVEVARRNVHATNPPPTCTKE